MGAANPKDPAEGLEPDITTIDDADDRRAEQQKYYGGDPLDEDDDDLSSLDRGDSLEPEPIKEDRGDEIPSEDEEDDEDAEAKDDESEADDDGDADGDSEAEEDVDDDDESDDEDGDDGDDSADDDGDDGESEDSAENDRGIPRHRFNEVNERRKQAERELAELKAQQQAQAQAQVEKFDFDAAEDEYMELLLDGKTKEAGAKRREIRAAEQELFKNEAKTEAVQDFDQQAELRDLNSLSLQAEEAYPVFNESSPDYDPIISQKVITYMKGYMASDMSMSDAFVAGLADVIEQYNLDGSPEPEPKPEPKPKAKKGKPIKKTAEKIKAAKQQGQTPAQAGEGSADRGVAAPSIQDMSDDDLDRLTPEQMARMRGDFVE